MTQTTLLRIALVALVTTPLTLTSQATPAAPAAAAPARTPRADSLRTANRLDVDGKTSEARAIFAALIASAPDDAARAAAQRSMAMSYGFDGDCNNAIKYEEMVMAYWRTREQAEPQNAFYQQGEMANEAARVCIDAGALDLAEKYYRMGTELGNKEPAPRKNPASLWAFRWHHAQARLAARRGKKDDAWKHVEMAKQSLASDTAMAGPQRRFLPYLEGYVALYTGDAVAAEGHLTRALAERGNERDPFYH
ncbi:MAG: hypothetical protein K2X99_10675 [Gemmatimonadaceae bacterium]|nr:hypothetical protein [Gemmatimonadaceae bacterium]